MLHWTVEEAQQNFPLLIQQIRDGESVVLSVDGQDVGFLQPLSQPARTPTLSPIEPSQDRFANRRDAPGLEKPEEPELHTPLVPGASNPPFSRIRLGALAGRASIPEDWKSIGMDDWEAHFEQS